jgi:hypothetical protein
MSCERKIGYHWLLDHMSDTELDAIKLENIGNGLIQFKWDIKHDDLANELLKRIDNQ